MSAGRPRLAMYWAAACGGCEVAVLNLGHRLLALEQSCEIVFFPCIADFKLKDVLELSDGSIDLCLFNGAIRSTENLEMAELLRSKSRLLVAFGSCAHEGCIPALANLSSVGQMWEAVYGARASTETAHARPSGCTQVPEGELVLPTLFPSVRALDQVVDVDYTIPGCPPEPDRVWEALEILVAAVTGVRELPDKGSVLGAGSATVCEECHLRRLEGAIGAFVRPHLYRPSLDTCLLEQGLVCLGVATRSGCGAKCPRVGMGCRGCYGAPGGVEDQGAKMMAAIASLIDVDGSDGDEQALARRTEEAMASLADPAGTLYRFSLCHSMLQQARVSESERVSEREDAADHD